LKIEVCAGNPEPLPGLAAFRRGKRGRPDVLEFELEADRRVTELSRLLRDETSGRAAIDSSTCENPSGGSSPRLR
jgi:hypothetical protein